ncbi:GNAT family N-acetyltransferase [Chelatococcus sp. SYSU_G07232]|uniref:GNAT family N-acetyltransferase n=2 Tax=Chelatococcus albus TaxID=3047466 RepID=A0ABT7ADL3_9HYPH|nr:GNAT family N-acetyltransferase [Chelatococcus sp. SYSU_G07232]MDJ1157471.1 GNAT family N-acetyltransferase [Chelatococcus sp. SYSU_G07232]
MNAWPALQTVLADGWVMRFSEGYTKRANSACAFLPHPKPIAEMAQEIEASYARHGQPAIMRITPLAHPDDAEWLAERGFRSIDETLILTAPLTDQGGDRRIVVDARPSEAWLVGFAAGNRYGPSVRPTLEKMLAAIRPQAGYATLIEAGEARAYGLAVVERGMVGLFDILVESAHRGRGLGRALVSSLMAWGREQGAAEAYLQVMATNAPAIALYRSLGFADAYRYAYWLR